MKKSNKIIYPVAAAAAFCLAPDALALEAETAQENDSLKRKVQTRVPHG